jgi:hypothetical protein
LTIGWFIAIGTASRAGFFAILCNTKISKGAISDENAIQSYEIDPSTGRREIVDPH